MPPCRLFSNALNKDMPDEQWSFSLGLHGRTMRTFEYIGFAHGGVESSISVEQFDLRWLSLPEFFRPGHFTIGGSSSPQNQLSS